MIEDVFKVSSFFCFFFGVFLKDCSKNCCGPTETREDETRNTPDQGGRGVHLLLLSLFVAIGEEA